MMNSNRNLLVIPTHGWRPLLAGLAHGHHSRSVYTLTPSSIQSKNQEKFDCLDCLVYFFQRAFAAFKAIVFRCLEDSFLALALPPLGPPSLPRATALASLRDTSTLSGEPSICSPMAFSTTWKAIDEKSRPRSLTIKWSVKAPVKICNGNQQNGNR
jgi:hypothetical protein